MWSNGKLIDDWYEHVQLEIIIATNQPFETKKLQGKWDRVRLDFKIMYWLLKQEPSLGWDVDRCAILATEDTWKKVIAVKAFHHVLALYNFSPLIFFSPIVLIIKFDILHKFTIIYLCFFWALNHIKSHLREDYGPNLSLKRPLLVCIFIYFCGLFLSLSQFQEIGTKYTHNYF